MNTTTGDEMPVKINEKFRTLLRFLTDEENDGLRNKLSKEGLTKPLDVWKEENTLIDGHHRLQLCRDLGLEPHFTYHSFADENEAILWILDNQEFSRNQSPIDKIATARIRERVYADQAKARQACGQGGVLLVEKLPQATEKTRDKAAAHAGVSGKTYEAGKRVLDHGAPELVQAVREKKASVSAASEVATLPQDEQREVVAKGEKEILARAKEIRAHKAAERKRETDEIRAKKVKPVDGLFDVIVIDPPWPMKKIERDVRPNQVDFDYPVMTEEELSTLKIPADESCHVWVWTTQKFLPMALHLLGEWGLRYVCTFTWHKPGGFQPIGLPQYNSEFALYARRGTPKFIDTKAFPTCFNAPRGKHSEKPSEFYEMVARVTDGRRLDMFNRREIDGFDGWGNESK